MAILLLTLPNIQEGQPLQRAPLSLAEYVPSKIGFEQPFGQAVVNELPFWRGLVFWLDVSGALLCGRETKRKSTPVCQNEIDSS